MDIAKRDALLRRINYAGSNDCFPVVVTIEEFFEGNDSLGSFWCNLPNQPDNFELICTFLTNVRDRVDVADLKIMLTQFEANYDEWPFSDTVLIDTSADPEEVASWFAEYAADEVSYADWSEETGFPNCIAVWWD